jgi:hypothetical protein
VSTPRTNFVCTIAGCEKPAAASQLCDKHYARLRRHGDPTVARRAHGLTTEERFWTKVDKRGPGECWPWLESTKPAGYGNCEGRPAHRVAYELLVGPIPEGFQIDHTCHNGTGCTLVSECPHRACCNPAHLEAVTQDENKRRGNSANGMKTHCKWGHPLVGTNVYFTKNGHRSCRACRRKGSQRKRAVA